MLSNLAQAPPGNRDIPYKVTGANSIQPKVQPEKEKNEKEKIEMGQPEKWGGQMIRLAG